MSETEIEPAKFKTQAQKNRSLMKICQLLASVGSEGGMSTYESRHEQLQKILKQWQGGEEVVVFANDDFNEPPDDVNPNLMKVDSRIPPSAETHINNSLPMNIVHPAEFSDTSSVILNLKRREKKLDINEISVPPKMKRKGKPKGTETTVVVIPKKKKLSTKLAPYANLLPKKNCKFILRCLVNASAAESALGKEKLLTSSDVKKSLLILDFHWDENSLDIQRVQIYFETASWKTVKRAIDEKKKCKWICFVCNKFIDDGESTEYESCLLWGYLLH